MEGGKEARETGNAGRVGGEGGGKKERNRGENILALEKVGEKKRDV